ncbi:molybdate ABC transporter substrate-binding protein [Listeria fleischmannii FSL S10-1203]|uniref:Molybdate ABC transporter substrate-binding protein n=1 Tax=Listeria fleischmannii FSL S10-1203 TaxID=1265822 RepID=W7DLZ3_9LIST|nr:molybdate ABC transporter substrate-binding protein [Listeria fleischmannii FSL S10-1203]
MKKWFFILLGVSFILTSCGHDNDMAITETTELHISVAASLKDVMDNVKKTYEKENPETKLTFDFAGSGQIKERVKSGAPIDGILLASEKEYR